MDRPTASTATPTTGATIAGTRASIFPCGVAEEVGCRGEVDEEERTLLVCELVEGEAEDGGLDKDVGA